jgi:hypothetical protein
MYIFENQTRFSHSILFLFSTNSVIEIGPSASDLSFAGKEFFFSAIIK